MEDQLVDISERRRSDKLRLGYRVWGSGITHVIFIHGNMASKAWLSLAAPYFPASFKVWAIDWRGCGDSDTPEPKEDYSNYSIETHAHDILAALDVLQIERCHIATHSAGGIIATYMLLEQPERFGRVLALDPVTPRGVNPGSLGDWRKTYDTMRQDPDFTRRVMACTAPSLFEPLFDTKRFLAGESPQFATTIHPSQRDAFENIVVNGALAAPDGIRFGTVANLIHEHECYFAKQKESLARKIKHMTNEHLLLWGQYDEIIPEKDS